MTLARMINRPCTLVYAGADGDPDADGVPTVEAPDPVDTLCEFQQMSSSEADLERTEVESYRVFLLPSVTPRAEDQLIVDGVTYEMAGPPNAVRSPRTHRLHHWECIVERAS